MANLFIKNYGFDINNLRKDLNKEIANKKQVDKSSKFKDLLNENIVKFSAHAQKRLQMRNIKITNEGIDKIKNGIEKLKNKGGKDSVVIMDDNAFVVSVKNNTVITVVDDRNLRENVFTNIDSMIIL
ncbi:TIGR02530 family flagellar biosynthesis protein [Haliovirga abyssi]|uniref:Flagellar protein n=1 Tax=Haliovirga abyssi TaxID=2996794 RepID=A0AAU9DSR9_9FUSO|nr:TIGR02530 family flagellar biosynthesis protein [Haliovirga abyssi]BDU50109.1 flagellar protein [Haliovirga abyssi]